MVISAINNNIEKAKKLLGSISDDIYVNTSVSPYYSSIGGHIRHILDVFDCALDGFPEQNINLIARKRDPRVENDRAFAIDKIVQIQRKLHHLSGVDFDTIVPVTDDLGSGAVTLNYTLGAILAQAQSHAIHHFAIIGYILNVLNVEVTDKTFGYNPTTPKNEVEA
ncbi:MAG: hypothetical protein CO119_08405 [Flavobacteriales bacterium CG_4_9_14_3_um_filter_40_17]|nr:MAG: hypothetical protein CO119_08405 [Flavobacteriales bacterium CG_4_9_14_3_um_filter_40_17]